MAYMKIVLMALVGVAFIFTPAFAQAQVQTGNPFRAVVIVNDGAITEYEIAQRAQMLRLLTPTPDTVARETAQKDLINERLYDYAAGVLGIVVGEADVDAGMTDFAARGTLSLPQLVEYLRDGGVDESSFRAFIQSGVLWQQVLGLRFGAYAQISDSEVETALNSRAQTQILVEMSEIVIPHERDGQIQAQATVAELRRTLDSEAAFASAARRLSASPSAQNSGRMPVIPVASMPPEAMLEVMRLEVGQTSPPIELDGATALYRLHSRREQTLGKVSDSVLYGVVRFDNGGEAEAVLAQSDRCSDLRANADKRRVSYQANTAKEDELAGDIRDALAGLDPNEARVLTRDDGFDVVMLCSRASVLPDEDLNRLRDVMFGRRIDEIGDGYLQELRANAHIVYK